MTDPERGQDQVEFLKSGLVLYIETELPANAEPIIDVVTGKMTSVLRLGKSNGNRWRGVHTCKCGAKSDNTDYILPSGHQTNSLAIHYVALHRDEIPPEQIDFINALEYGAAMPTEAEIQQPRT